MATCTQAESSSQSSSKPISIGNNTNTTLLGDSALFGSLSSSAGKHKRPTTMKQRRMSSTATAIAHSLPSNTTATTHYSVSASHSGLLSPVAGTSSGTSTRPRSTSSNNLMYHNNNNNLDDDDEGEIRPGRKIKGETYACEKCNKVSFVPAHPSNCIHSNSHLRFPLPKKIPPESRACLIVHERVLIDFSYGPTAVW